MFKYNLDKNSFHYVRNLKILNIFSNFKKQIGNTFTPKNTYLLYIFEFTYFKKMIFYEYINKICIIYFVIV